MRSHHTVSDPQLPGVIAPTLFIRPAANDMMQAYVDEVGEAEINGFGYVSAGSDGDFHWNASTDVFITEQTVTPGTADVAKAVFAKAVHKSMVDGREDDLRLQWHSHVWGKEYHSHIDMNTIEDFALAGMSSFISLVTNKHGRITARLDMFRPYRIGVPMRVVIRDDASPHLSEQAQAEISRLVTIEPRHAASKVLAPRTGAAVITRL